MAKKRIKSTAVSAAQTLDEAREKIARIGYLQRRISDIENAMNDEVAALKERFAAAASPMLDEVDDLFDEVQTWAEANRNELCDGARKSAMLSSGEIGWRFTPYSVKVSKVAEVLERLKKARLTRFIRRSETVNKEAILECAANRERAAKVDGIEVLQTEEFYIKPFETELEKAVKCKRVA